jgi:hypothetical protein
MPKFSAQRVAAPQAERRQQGSIIRRYMKQMDKQSAAELDLGNAAVGRAAPTFEATRISPASVSSPSASYPLQAASLRSLTAYDRG